MPARPPSCTSRSVADGTSRRRPSTFAHRGDDSAVAIDRDVAAGLRLGVRARRMTHLLELEPAFVSVPDRLRKSCRVAGRDNDPTAVRSDDLGRLAVLVRVDDHRATDRENPVEAAWHDVAGETGGKTDDVEIGARERLREPLARLVGKEADVSSPSRFASSASSAAHRARSDHDELEIVEVAQVACAA